MSLIPLRNALAILVAAEARIHELVDPAIVHDHVRDLVKAQAAAIEQLAERVAALEAHAPAVDPPPTPEPLPVVVTSGEGNGTAEVIEDGGGT